MRKSIIKKIIPLRSVPDKPFVFLWEALYGCRAWFLTGIALAFLLSLSKILLPVFFSNMIGYFSTITPQDFSWQKISFYLLQLLIVFLAANIIRFVREYTDEAVVRIYLRVKLNIFGVDYLSKHSENYLSGQKSGQLSQKIIGLKNNTSVLTSVINRMASCLFLIAIIFFYIGRVNLLFVLLTLIFGSISCWFSYKQSFVLKKINREVNDKYDQYKGTIIDSISNLLAVKLFGREKHEQKVVMDTFAIARDARIKELTKLQNILSLQSILLGVFDIIGILIALYLWYNQKIDIGEVVLIIMLLGQALSNFRRFMGEVSYLNRSYGEVSSSLTPFLEKHEIVDPPKAKKLKVKKGAIKFDNVSFSYNKKNVVFKDFNLLINPKEKIGIVGKSGSGKSTLIKLLQRLYIVDSGAITIDDQNIGKVTQSSLSDNIALIPQDTSLFHRSIRQNIAYGKTKASLREIINASKNAYVDEFVKTLPREYDTMVGEKGIKLSGGQRQRIAIARAILKDSPILILDEATSALDNESEQKITQSIKKLMKGKTVIAIAHRLSTLKEMDRIIVIDNGKIIEEGSPSDLIDKQGKFAKLWKLQTA